MTKEEYIGKLEDIIIKCQELLIKSEARIDKTNAMIEKTFGTFADIANVYENQIKHLQQNRDIITTQNSELIKLLQEEKDTVHEINRKYDILIERLLQTSNRSENNFNIHN